MSNSVTQLFAAMDGARIPGGCDACDAYQDVALVDGITRITVCHDDDCPRTRHPPRKEPPMTNKQKLAHHLAIATDRDLRPEDATADAIVALVYAVQEQTAVLRQLVKNTTPKDDR